MATGTTPRADLVDYLTPVGVVEICDLLGVKRKTLDQARWRERQNPDLPADHRFPSPRWSVGGRPAWARGDVLAWARVVGRPLPELPPRTASGKPAVIRTGPGNS